MRRLLLSLILIPHFAWAYVSGMDDININITQDVENRLDDAILTYYQHPSPQKVETVLDIMNTSPLLEKKTAWAPTIGFLSVVFANNKEHLFDWMGKNNYNTYAQDVFVTALLHAKLPETAVVFAQAHQWKQADLEHLRLMHDNIDLKHLPIVLPGHIDTLWGAFFASGDQVYADEVVNSLPLGTNMAVTDDLLQDKEERKTLAENIKLAKTTLKKYAAQHKPVRDALLARIASEKDATTRRMLESLLPEAGRATTPWLSTAVLAFGAAIVALLTALCLLKRKRKLPVS